jgi:serine/threonine-protein kinase HipA
MTSNPGAGLSVFLRGELVGRLERRGPARYRFGYDRSGTEGEPAEGLALSASLPVESDVFTPSQTAPFFEGLLPEGTVRAAIARSFHLSEEDGFGMLAALGADCAGAVSVLPPDAEPHALGEGRLKPLSAAELARLVEELPRHPLGVDASADGVRLSLGGIQHKLVLVRMPLGKKFAQPLDGAPSNCLLKPEFGQYKDLVANEAFCMKVAETTGLNVAWVELIFTGDTPCLYVERFDRTRDEFGRIQRIHQEDMCQAFGVLPAAKYEENGGPSVAGVVELLRRLRSPNMARDINEFLHAVLFNFLIGNSDAHGKNFALLYEPPLGARLAPLYDLVSTAAYPEVSERMAMGVGGVVDPAQVDMAAWLRLGDECGFGRGIAQLVRRRSGAILRDVESTRQRAIDDGWHRPVIDSIVDVCRERADRLLRG